MNPLKLYDYYRSSASFRVRIALNLKNLSYDIIPVHLLNNGGEQFSDDYKKINSQSLVPTLQDGNQFLTQSIAIIEYLNDLHPNPPLLPAKPLQKALVRSFALTIAADIHPLNNLRVLKYLKQELNMTEDQKNAWYQHWQILGLTSLEKTLNLQPHTTIFCFGDTPTLADICLIPQLYNARRFHCDLSNMPTLTKIETNCEKLSAFSHAKPKESIT